MAGSPNSNLTIDATQKLPDMWDMSKHSIDCGSFGIPSVLRSESIAAIATGAGEADMSASTPARAFATRVSSIAAIRSRHFAARSKSSASEASRIFICASSTAPASRPRRYSSAAFTLSAYSASPTIFSKLVIWLRASSYNIHLPSPSRFGCASERSMPNLFVSSASALLIAETPRYGPK